MVKYLFPHKYKVIGIALLAISLAFITFQYFTRTEIQIPLLMVYSSGEPFSNEIQGFWGHFFRIRSENISNEISGILLIVGALIATFSKEKQEDEFIAKLRLESLVWATFVNYGVLLLLIITIYGIDFLYVMEFNMCTFLLLAFSRFNYQLYKSRVEAKNG